MLLVKIKAREEEKVDKENQAWCYVIDQTGGEKATFCDGEYFEYGCAIGVEYETKEVQKGGITCKRCLEKIKEIKAIKT